MIFYLHNDLKPYFSDKVDPFAALMAMRGEVYRKMDGRVTQRIFIGGNSYFIKQHTGVGWREITKNLIQGRLPIVSAKNEWQALAKLTEVGIPVPAVVGYGMRGTNPANLQSFVLLEDLSPMQSLEALCQTWQQSPPNFLYKKKLIEEVAKITKKMHTLGINHRDLYLCHFLLRGNTLYLFDLHRAAIRKQTPMRWQIKDLSGLYFSSKYYMHGLTQRDLLRFIRVYGEKTLREMAAQEKYLWQKVKTRGERLYNEHR